MAKARQSEKRSTSAPPRIEDHAMIGDLRTAALVTRNGMLDWMCLPAFDSDACFAALLGNADNGCWTISPSAPVREIRRRYRENTLILETDFVTDEGTARLVDFMPPRNGREASVVCRSIRGLKGSVRMRSEARPRLAFGRAVPLRVTTDSTTVLLAGPDALYLRGGPAKGAPALDAEFVVSEGSEVRYSMSYGASHEAPPPAEDVAKAERATQEYWSRWCATLRLPDYARELVMRSLITIKACIYEPTGAIVAAPTSSLPETPGGIRNWDYRFCWLRDGALSLRALILGGLTAEARAFFEWALRAIAGDPAQLQIMYGIRGERRLSEVELQWFEGYQGARPVRVGNAAFDQHQLDVYGELARVMYDAAERAGELRPDAVQALLSIARYVAGAWTIPDHGIWEMRGPERHFTASKVAAWMALDSAIRYVEERGLAESNDDLRKTRQTIHEQVCREGYNREHNTFTQYYGGTGVDASLLVIPLSGFLPPEDTRVQGTVAALERELMEDGLLLRFKPEGEVDGLSGREGTFLACTFWLATVYQMMGRGDDARRTFERAASVCNDLGLLAEEYDTRDKRQLGNFPQAFSHFALVSAAFAISEGASAVGAGGSGLRTSPSHT